MGPSMKGGGKMARLMLKEDSSMLMVISMMGTGKMTKHTDMESIAT